MCTSIVILSFIVLIFAWNVPLVSLIFLKRSLVFAVLFFSSISLHWSLRKAFLSLLAILWKFSLAAHSCPTLCDPMDCSLPDSSVHGIFQARILEWSAISFPRGSSQPRDQTQVSNVVGRCFIIWATREVTLLLKYGLCLIIQSCPTLCDPMDCSLTGSSVCGDLQARILEWVAYPSSRESSQPRNWTEISYIVDGFFTSWATRKTQSLQK